MIISHEHKFIFLKTKKTAGTAIEAALSELCGPSDVITPYREESEQERKGRGTQNFRIEHPLKPKRPLWRKLLGRPERYYHPSVGFYEHMPASLVRAYVGEEVWRSYYKFAFDRNPWDRQVSWYFYKTKSKRTRPSFERFMQSRRRAYVDNYEIYTEGGALTVDFLGRYERLDADLNAVLDTIGVKRKVEVPRTNVNPARDTRGRDARDYRKLYSDTTRDLVADWYQPEIALLGYGF
ncbi:MAG: sulfotransferase family 2 domain-containing protein [Usitatibacter sp.]